MLIRKLFLLPVVFLLVSCGQIVSNAYKDIDFSITSPKTNWIYYDNAKIMFAVNVDTKAIQWTSDICGYLGNGNHITLFLPEGLHRITAVIQGIQKERVVCVFPITDNAGTQSTLMNYSPMDIKIKGGECYSYLYSNESTIHDFRIVPEQYDIRQTYKKYALKLADYRLTELKRDIQLPEPIAGRCIEKQPVSTRHIGKRHSISTKRYFYVANTKNQYLQPHKVEAELQYQSDVLSIWLPVPYSLSEILAERHIETIEDMILPRITSIFGFPQDINDDGSIALLLTPTLNDEQAALGFFNPADFFEWNDDQASDSYNPASNEMDIIYAAFPDDDIQSAYNIDSVLATIAHELSHAATFTVKTWSRIHSGDANAEREALFLDEGLSHLAENLCGYGIRGGNIRFFQRFLDNTSMYSFCGVNQYGQEDSAGMRGAMTLFLSWLFWKAGGMSWDYDNPVTLVDNGGISFLRRLVTSEETGWENIGTVFGKPVNLLYSEMLDEINYYRVSNVNYRYRVDPVTSEAVDFFVNMGTIQNGTSTIDITFPKTATILDTSTLLPWSMVFFDPFYVPDNGTTVLYAGDITGSTYFAVTTK